MLMKTNVSSVTDWLGSTIGIHRSLHRSQRSAVFSRMIAVLIALATAVGWAGEIPLIAAASSLRFALQAIADSYVEETGYSVEISFGSSGNLTRQIIGGAPYQLFFSANEAYVERLQQHELVTESAVYAVGRLVLFVATDSGLRADLGDFTAAVEGGRLDQVVIANPERAPYGLAAHEVLSATGLWQPLERRIVLGNNVSHAAQFLSSGAVLAGFISYSLALAPELQARGEFVQVPGAEHHLRARAALLKGAGEEVAEFYRYMLRPAAQKVLQRHGFDSP